MLYEDKLKFLKTETTRVKSETKKRVAGYILAGFGIIVGLAWNDAVKSLIERIFPLSSGNGIISKFAYALVITLILVLSSIYLLDENNKGADK